MGLAECNAKAIIGVIDNNRGDTMSEKVLGPGGCFLKVRDPAALAAWYRDALGVNFSDYSGMFFAQFPFRTEDPGELVWTLFPESADHFPGPVMMNFRVRDLDAMLAQLRAQGAAVEDRVDDSEFGRFGWVKDPEGHRVELWQPPPAT
jgi:predicted enzyme related to lactoylglutathione lyase